MPRCAGSDGHCPAYRTAGGMQPRRGFPLEESEDLPAFRRRKNAKLLTVLGHRPTGDFDILVLQQLDDPLIRVRILRTLRADDLLDLELDCLGSQILPVGAS